VYVFWDISLLHYPTQYCRYIRTPDRLACEQCQALPGINIQQLAELDESPILAG